MVKFRNLALVIGINEYRNDPRIAPLTTARFDAIKLAEILKRDYDYDVELLTDDQQQATYDGIQQALARLPERISNAQQQGDQVRLIFYFAGHGISSQRALEEAGFLAAQDSEVEQLKQFVSMKDLHDKLTALDCHHALIILDCCFAGAFKFITRHLGFRRTPEEITKERYQRYEKSAAWQVLVSAAHDQKALDITLDNRGMVNSDREQPNSPFAAALFRAIDKTILADNDCTPADYTKDGITTATELFVFLDREMEQSIGKFSHQQVPRFWPLSKHDKGEVFFETGEFDFNRLPDTPELSPENNPYRGLESFDEAQQRFFFGREELVKELQTYVDRDHHPFTVVLGVSGSGKSSLVKAGLIPQLRGLQSSPWQILAPMRPGLSPLKALAKVLLSLEQESNPNEFQQLEQLTENLRNARKRSPDDKTLTQLLAEWRRNDPDGKLRLIVTKFEQWQQIVERQQLELLRQAGLHRSGLVLQHLEELSLHCSSQEQQALEAFYQHCTTQIECWSQQWQHDPEHLCALIEQWCDKDTSRKLLLVIDQFEELITQSQESERDAFLLCLRSMLRNFPQQLRVVATLRADFESRFVDNEQLQEFWQIENRFFVRPMRRDEFRQMIEGPAQDYVLSFGINDKKYSLVDQLIDEVELMPGGLPLLSFTLSELYREYVKSDRNDRTLSWDDYRNLNGVTGSLTRRATDEYKTLDEQHQVTMRWVMLRMVTFEGGETARRRVFDSELIYPTQEENDRVKQGVDLFVNSRLLVRGQLETGESYVEPAHDFLVRGWAMLQDWINEEKAKETLELQQRLAAQANDWARNQGPLLPDGDRLRRLEEILLLPDKWVNSQETELIQESIKQAREFRAREALPRKAARILDLLSTQPLQGLVLAIHTLGQNLEDLPKDLLSSVQSSLLKALEVARERNLMRGHEDKITSVSFSRDGSHIISGSEDGTIQLWDIQGTPIGSPFLNHRRAVRSVSFDSTGEFIISGGDDNIVQLWNKQGNLIYQSSISYQEKDSLGNQSRITSIAFNVIEQYIASGGTDGTVRFWGLDGQLIDSIFLGQDTGEIYIDFSQDGNSMVMGGPDRAVRLWSCQQKLISSPLADHGGIINCVSISDDGQYIASSSTYGITLTNAEGNLIEDIAGDLKTRPFQGHEGGINSVAISTDGQTIASAGENIRIWNQQGKQIGSSLKGHIGGVTVVKFSHDNQLLASGGTDGTVRLWDAQIPLMVGNSFLAFAPSVSFTSNNHIVVKYWDRAVNTNILQLLDLQGNPIGKPIFGTAISSDEKLILIKDAKGTVQLLDVQGNLICQALPEGWGHHFSPDGKAILYAISNEALQLVDSQGNPISKPFGEHKNFVSCTAFSSNSELIATGGDDAIIQLWDKQGTLVTEPFKGHEFRVTSIAFSPNDEYIVSGSIDRTVRLWDMRGKLINTFQGHRGAVNCVVFSPDGQYIASGSGFSVERTAPVSWDNTIRLWDMGGNPIGNPIEGHEAKVLSLSFSPDSRFIVSGSEDRTVRIWRANWESWLEGACDRLRHHPVFTNPESIEDPEQRNIAIAACKTCEKYVWSNATHSVE